MLRKLDKTLILIFVGALLLRLYGIFHGFPFIFHPDEPTVVRSALALRFDLNPAHFDWPHHFIYLNYILYLGFIKFRGLLELLHLKSAVGSVFPILWDDTLAFYLISRIFTVLIGAATIVPLYLAVRLYFNRVTALFAAALFALIPFHVWQSHYVLIDVPMTFWVACSLYYVLRIFKYNQIIDYVLAGLFVGFAASTKYNGGLVCLPVLLAYIFREKQSINYYLTNIKKLFYAGFASIIGFLLGTPFALFDLDTFLRTDSPKGAIWQFTNVGSVDLAVRVQNIVTTLSTMFVQDLGIVIMVLSLISLCLMLARLFKLIQLKEYWFLSLSFWVVAFLVYYISGFSKNRSHYYMVAYPYMIMFAVYSYDYLMQKITNVRLRVLFSASLLIIPFFASLERSAVFARPDTRVQLYEWLSSNTSTGDVILYESSDLNQIFAKIRYDDNASRYSKLLPYLKDAKYAIISYSRIEEIDELELLEQKTQEKVFFNNNMRKGPNIKVYEILNAKP